MNFKKTDTENSFRGFGEKDVRSIITLLAVQSMIHLGEIPDPISRQSQVNLASADLFIGLLEVFREKTHGNLSTEEDIFLQEVFENLQKVRQNKGNDE